MKFSLQSVKPAPLYGVGSWMSLFSMRGAPGTSNFSLASNFSSFVVRALMDSCICATVFSNVWIVNAVFVAIGSTAAGS